MVYCTWKYINNYFNTRTSKKYFDILQQFHDFLFIAAMSNQSFLTILTPRHSSSNASHEFMYLHTWWCRKRFFQTIFFETMKSLYPLQS